MTVCPRVADEALSSLGRRLSSRITYTSCYSKVTSLAQSFLLFCEIGLVRTRRYKYERNSIACIYEAMHAICIIDLDFVRVELNLDDLQQFTNLPLKPILLRQIDITLKRHSKQFSTKK